jgi:hypothetical protein
MALGRTRSKVLLAPGGEGLIGFDYMAPGITRIPFKFMTALITSLLFVDDPQ